MAITKETIVDRIEIDALGNVSVRLSLLLVEDGATVLSSSSHRIVLDTEGIGPTLEQVNAHLQSMGHAPMAAEDAQRVDALRTAEAATTGRKAFAKSLDAAKKGVRP